ncbi:MAG: nucleotidyltransferase family protein [Actinobacteria bacterium]|nr:nucleotidyltransferase family protein [Actinomycetota bacterium]
MDKVTPVPSAVGIVLAAGAGRRFGMPKVLAEDGAWLRAAVAALDAGGCRPVYVVLGAAQVVMPPPALAIANPDWAAGMGTSLRAGLLAAEDTEAAVAVLHLVDLPDVGADVVARLVAGAGPGSLRRASYDGAPGHPVVLGRRHWDAALRNTAGDRGAGRYLDGHPDLRVIPCDDLADGSDRDYC